MRIFTPMNVSRKQVIYIVLGLLFVGYAICMLRKAHIATHQKPKAIVENHLQMVGQDKYAHVEVSSNARLAQSITADAAIVVDGTTGKVLFSKNPDRLEYPASMTKMMTCILAIESRRLDSIVTISSHAEESSDTYLRKGDRITLSNLLYLLMLSSNNGSAVAVGEYISGNLNRFINLMNTKARALGMTQTHFVTPNGRHHPQHYSTARDMALLARYCMRNPQFREVVKTPQRRVRYKVPAGKNFLCRNENKLLELYPGVNGVKTGFTETALGCLATSFESRGTRLIVVVMHAHKGQRRLHETVKLLDWTRITYKMR